MLTNTSNITPIKENEAIFFVFNFFKDNTDLLKSISTAFFRIFRTFVIFKIFSNVQDCLNILILFTQLGTTNLRISVFSRTVKMLKLIKYRTTFSSFKVLN